MTWCEWTDLSHLHDDLVTCASSPAKESQAGTLHEIAGESDTNHYFGKNSGTIYWLKILTSVWSRRAS